MGLRTRRAIVGMMIEVYGVSAVSEAIARYLVAVAVSRKYLAFSISSPLPPRDFVIGNLDMADVSDPEILQG